MYILGYSGFTRDSHLLEGFRSSLAKTNQTFDNIFNYREGEVPFSRFPLGFFGHDASAALFNDGKIIAAAAEERFTRIKYSLNLSGNTLLPRNAINYCLKEAGISIKDVGVTAHYCDFSEETIKKRINLIYPWLLNEEKKCIEESYYNILNSMMSNKVVVKQFKEMMGFVPEIFLPVLHHYAHAASCFYPSGFKEALILTIDGTGETESSLVAVCEGDQIKEIERKYIPISLGSLYLIITVFLGFRSLGDEYKVMGLAAYGNPKKYRSFFNSLVVRGEKGNYSTDLLASSRLKELILENLGEPKKTGDSFTQKDADIAAALQESLNGVILHQLKYLRKETGLRNLCMAGGVALNCTLNGAIARSGLFDKIFIQPAANDEGCSVGAALFAYSKLTKSNKYDKWNHAYWGPEYSDEEIIKELKNFDEKIICEKHLDIVKFTAGKLKEGKVIGWFQGRMEFGPRALGNRSILANPCDPEMKDRINEKVKRRESFRPFAPAVLEEDSKEYFDMMGLADSAFMLFAVPVNEKYKNKIPAVVHVDGSARVQTVSKKSNTLFWNLIFEFKKLTGVSVILNTSFNVRNEPIVCSPKDAIQCFLSTDIDCLVLGNFFIIKR